MDEKPIWFYFQGIGFWIFLMAIPLGLFIRYSGIPFWIGFAIIIPWCLFWAYKGHKKYQTDRLNQ